MEYYSIITIPTIFNISTFFTISTIFTTKFKWLEELFVRVDRYNKRDTKSQKL